MTTTCIHCGRQSANPEGEKEPRCGACGKPIAGGAFADETARLAAPQPLGGQAFAAARAITDDFTDDETPLPPPLHLEDDREERSVALWVAEAIDAATVAPESVAAAAQQVVEDSLHPDEIAAVAEPVIAIASIASKVREPTPAVVWRELDEEVAKPPPPPRDDVEEAVDAAIAVGPPVTTMAASVVIEAPRTSSRLEEVAPSRRAVPRPPMVRVGWVARAVAATVLVLALVAGAVARYTPLGAELLLASRHELAAEPTLDGARALLGVGGVGATEQSLFEADRLAAGWPHDATARAIAAQAHLELAREGWTGERALAHGLLADLVDDARADAVIARAMASLADGKPAEVEVARAQPFAPPPVDARARVVLAEAHLARGDLRAAVADCDAAIAEDATQAAPHVLRAKALAALGDPTAAEAGYREALRLQPGHLAASLGLLELAPPDPAHVEEAIVRLFDAHPRDVSPRLAASAWMILGRVASSIDLPSLAEDRFRRARRLDASLDATIALADALLVEGHASDAVTLLSPSLAAHPHDLALLGALGEARVATGDGAGGRKLLMEVLAASEHDVRARYAIGRAAEAERIEPAREAAAASFRDILARDPRHAGALVHLETALREPDEEEHDRSRELHEKHEALDEKLLPETFLQAARHGAPAGFDVALARAWRDAGEPERAETLLRASIHDGKEPLLARWTLLRLAIARGHLDEAQDSVAALAQDAPTWPGLAQSRAEIALARGHLVDALADFDRALSQRFPPSGLRLEAARAALAAGQAERAGDPLRALLAVEPDHAEAHLLLAQVALAQAQPAVAAAEVTRALALSPTAEAHLLAARVSLTLGRDDDAIAHYAAAASLAGDEDERVAAAAGRARVLARQGHAKDALALLKPLVHRRPSPGAVSLAVAECYAQLGHKSHARDAYRKYLATARPDDPDRAAAARALAALESHR